MTDKQKIVVIF